MICDVYVCKYSKMLLGVRYNERENNKIVTLGPTKGLVKTYGGGGVGRSREGGGHEVLSLVQGVGRAIFSYPQGVGHPIFY